MKLENPVAAPAGAAGASPSTSSRTKSVQPVFKTAARFAVTEKRAPPDMRGGIQGSALGGSLGAPTAAARGPVGDTSSCGPNELEAGAGNGEDTDCESSKSSEGNKQKPKTKTAAPDSRPTAEVDQEAFDPKIEKAKKAAKLLQSHRNFLRHMQDGLANASQRKNFPGLDETTHPYPERRIHFCIQFGNNSAMIRQLLRQIKCFSPTLGDPQNRFSTVKYEEKTSQLTARDVAQLHDINLTPCDFLWTQYKCKKFFDAQLRYLTDFCYITKNTEDACDVAYLPKTRHLGASAGKYRSAGATGTMGSKIAGSVGAGVVKVAAGLVTPKNRGASGGVGAGGASARKDELAGRVIDHVAGRRGTGNETTKISSGAGPTILHDDDAEDGIEQPFANLSPSSSAASPASPKKQQEKALACRYHNHLEGNQVLCTKVGLFECLKRALGIPGVYQVLPYAYVCRNEEDIEKFAEIFNMSWSEKKAVFLPADVRSRRGTETEIGSAASDAVVDLVGGSVAKKHKSSTAKSSKTKGNVWLLKPGLYANRGFGIEIMTNLESIQAHLRKKIHKTPYLLQKYIERPFLVDSRKFDIRAYALASTLQDDLDRHRPEKTFEAFYFTDWYVRTTSTTYSCSDFENRLKHLNNDAVQKHGKDYGKFESANKLSIPEFERYLRNYQGTASASGAAGAGAGSGSDIACASTSTSTFPADWNTKNLTEQIKGHMKTAIGAALKELNPRRIPGYTT
eukprot:g7399.t1